MRGYMLRARHQYSVETSKLAAMFERGETIIKSVHSDEK